MKDEQSHYRYSLAINDRWFVAFIDQQYSAISIMSSDGNFSYRCNKLWRTHQDFRKELLESDTISIKENLANYKSSVFNIEKTIKNIQSYILKLRRDNYISSWTARSDWDLITNIQTLVNWHQFIDSSGLRYELYFDQAVYEPLNIDGLNKWMKESWPSLKLMLEYDVKKNPYEQSTIS